MKETKKYTYQILNLCTQSVQHILYMFEKRVKFELEPCLCLLWLKVHCQEQQRLCHNPWLAALTTTQSHHTKDIQGHQSKQHTSVQSSSWHNLSSLKFQKPLFSPSGDTAGLSWHTAEVDTIDWNSRAHNQNACEAGYTRKCLVSETGGGGLMTESFNINKNTLFLGQEANISSVIFIVWCWNVCL